MVEYKGWRMALVAFICIVFAFGASTTTMPLIYGPAMDEFNWTRTQATLIFTYKNITSAIIAMFVIGPVIDRFGLKPVMVTSFVLTGLGMVSFLWISSLLTYYLAGILIGSGIIAILISAKVLVSRWFMRNLGLAIGLTVVGTSVGGVIFPLIAQVMIDAFGWRTAFASLSLGLWCIALPLYLLVADDRPTDEDITLEASAKGTPPEMVQRLREAELDVSYRDIIKTPMYWMITAAVFFTALADSGVLQHTVLLLEREKGFDSRVAAASISGMFGLGIIAKVAAGRIYDRFSVKGIQAWYGLLGLSILLVFPLEGLSTLIIFTLVRGIAHGGIVSSDTGIIAKHCYGPRMVSRMIAVLTGIFAIGSALGPLTLSAIYDSTGSYRNGFILFAVLCVFAVLLMHNVRPYYRERLEAARGSA